MIHEQYTHVREDGTTQHRYWPPAKVVSDWIAWFFPEGFNGHCVDVGASDGISSNSTYLLEQLHWTVLSVEANPYFKESLNGNRALVEMCGVGGKDIAEAEFHIHLDNPEAFSSLDPHPDEKFAAQVGSRWGVSKIPVRSLNSLLDRHRFPKLDVLCVDTEGTERDVLSGIDLVRWSPRVVVVETWVPGSLDDVLVPLGYIRLWRNVDNDGYFKENA